MSVVINSSFDAEKKIWNLKLGGEIDIYTSNNFKEELQKEVKNTQLISEPKISNRFKFKEKLFEITNN